MSKHLTQNKNFTQIHHHKMLALALTTSIIAPIAAQAEDENTRLTLEEIIVTAEKREKSLQQTPIAITALNSEALETAGITDITDLRSNVPSLSIAPFAQTRTSPLIFIRAMGNVDIQTTKDGAVGIYIDGVPLGRGTALSVDVAELERIEVLRGPQGTLYGRNTTGGAINFITQKPHEEMSVKQKASVGNYSHWLSKTTVNIPLTDKIFVKAGYLVSETDGWVKNTNTTLTNQTDFYADDKEAFNIAVRVLATENFTIDYAYGFANQTYGNGFYQIVEGPLAVTGRQEEAATPSGLTPGDEHSEGHNLTLAYDFDTITLKSITGLRKTHGHTDQNYNNFFTQIHDHSQDQFSQEIQIIGSAFDGRFEYVTGLYYFEEDGEEVQTSNFGVFDVWQVAAESKTKAVYGQGTWTPDILDDHLRLTLGLRYTIDDRTASKLYITNGLSATPDGTLALAEGNYKKFNPSFTIDYDFSENITGYAKVATGYRAGGFNTRSTVPGFTAGFAQEDVTSWEVGVKSDLLDGRMRLNVAGFLNKYTDLQVDQVRPVPIFTDTINAGSATIKGIEVELNAILAEGLTLNAFYVYLDAEYDEYIDNGVDLADVKNVPYANKGQLKVGLQYEAAPFSFGRLIMNVDFEWQNDVFSGPNPNTSNDAYGIWNARIQLADVTIGNTEARIAAWGRNLSDKVYSVASTNLVYPSMQFGTPRTYGFDVTIEF